MARKHRHRLIPSLLPDVLNPVHQLRVMGRLVRRRGTRPGAAPGTLVHTGPRHVELVSVRVMGYGPDHFEEREVAGVADAFPFPEHCDVTWVDVVGLHDVELVREVGERLGVHMLVLEDIVSTGQRPKIEEHEGYLYIVIPMLSIDPESGTVRDEQLSILLGAGWVVTFQERTGDDFGPVRERLRTKASRLRTRPADYLCYTLVDAVVDHYFSVLETVGDAAERVELEVFEHPQADTMHRLHALKRELLVVRRAVWPVREMVNSLLRTESPLVSDPTRLFLRDVYDHAVRIIDTVEVLRDLLGGTIDLYLSGLSNRTNEIMKALTIMAGIFIPLTFIAGIYGMNFEHMPELEWPWAYPALLALMAALVAGMLWNFRRRGWL